MRWKPSLTLLLAFAGFSHASAEDSPLALQSAFKVHCIKCHGKDGKVKQIGKITGSDVFHEAAKAAAQKWEFEPAMQNDKPVKVWVSLPFTFKLN